MESQLCPWCLNLFLKFSIQIPHFKKVIFVILCRLNLVSAYNCFPKCKITITTTSSWPQDVNLFWSLQHKRTPFITSSVFPNHSFKLVGIRRFIVCGMLFWIVLSRCANRFLCILLFFSLSNFQVFPDNFISNFVKSTVHFNVFEILFRQPEF